MKLEAAVSATKFALLTTLCLLGTGACQGAKRLTSPAQEPFIALERDFQGYESWPRIELEHRATLGDAHADADAHEYINQLPPAGSRTFPVGTILVKTMKSARVPGEAGAESASGMDIFAMVKRGAGYNSQGSPGWEWFELRARPDHSLGIVWRGANPPDGEGYGREVRGGCNSCHQGAATNDYVKAPGLTLSKI